MQSRGLHVRSRGHRIVLTGQHPHSKHHSRGTLKRKGYASFQTTASRFTRRVVAGGTRSNAFEQ